MRRIDRAIKTRAQSLVFQDADGAIGKSSAAEHLFSTTGRPQGTCLHFVADLESHPLISVEARALRGQPTKKSRPFLNTKFDVTIVGAGIVGLATAVELTQRCPQFRILVVDKEPAIAS